MLPCIDHLTLCAGLREGYYFCERCERVITAERVPETEHPRCPRCKHLNTLRWHAPVYAPATLQPA